MGLVPQQFAVDRVRGHISFVVVDDDEAFPRKGDVLRGDEIRRSFQRSQKIAEGRVH